jgi:2-hydroxy-6-oxonona-2,4-dienedioate hydrolase
MGSTWRDAVRDRRRGAWSAVNDEVQQHRGARPLAATREGAFVTSSLTDENTRRIVETADYRIVVNEAGSGHPIFFIHGSGPGASGWSNFAPNISALSDKYRCIAVTMPGWGESSVQSVSTGRDQGRAVLQLMDALGVERAAFVGNSMGGGIGLWMAGVHPDRTSHVITMGSGVWGPSLLTPGVPSEGIRTLVEAYRDPSENNFRKMVQVMCFDQEFASDELVTERASAARAHPEHLVNWLELMAAGVGAAEVLEAAQHLPSSPVPALLVHGRDDRTVHFELSLRTLALIPNSRLVLLNRCGHWAQLEHADEFNRLVEGFVVGA